MLLNSMGAKGEIAPGLHQRKTMTGFEPLTVHINQRKERHGHSANLRSSLSQLIKYFFLRSIQKIVGSYGGDALSLVRQVRWGWQSLLEECVRNRTLNAWF